MIRGVKPSFHHNLYYTINGEAGETKEMRCDSCGHKIVKEITVLKDGNKIIRKEDLWLHRRGHNNTSVSNSYGFEDYKLICHCGCSDAIPSTVDLKKLKGIHRLDLRHKKRLKLRRG